MGVAGVLVSVENDEFQTAGSLITLKTMLRETPDVPERLTPLKGVALEA